MTNNRVFKPGDRVIIWVEDESQELSKLALCTVEKAHGCLLTLFAIEENQLFYRRTSNVMTFEELEIDFTRISKDLKNYDNLAERR